MPGCWIGSDALTAEICVEEVWHGPKREADVKAKILSQLSQSATFISGERLSATLGVSRVAVWKHIRQLQELGYRIETSSKGYRLLSGPDTPFPWAFGERADRVHYYPEVGSTMDIAMELARGGCSGSTVVVAERQTRGRGRLQRNWQSTAGGLYFTMILRPQMEPSTSSLINLAAAVDLADVLESLYGIRVQLKWPNDVLVDGRKLAGILSQMVADPDRIEFVNLGIGINVHNDTRNLQPPAVSVASLTAQPVSRAHILASFWDRFEQRLDTGDLSGVVPQWKQRALTLGRHVKVQTFHEMYEGVAVDIEKNGGLILKTAEGNYTTVIYGDCFHQDG
ncbi:MAG: biotin--[acetyl-CoA-carboxylase] ligase [Desulfobacteraceae bacterium]|nr:MAG: biotin--[acetyl-CoA-carboxylase] ligase [Desulfobacteraceae bacterium]